MDTQVAATRFLEKSHTLKAIMEKLSDGDMLGNLLAPINIGARIRQANSIFSNLKEPSIRINDTLDVLINGVPLSPPMLATAFDTWRFTSTCENVMPDHYIAINLLQVFKSIVELLGNAVGPLLYLAVYMASFGCPFIGKNKYRLLAMGVDRSQVEAAIIIERMLLGEYGSEYIVATREHLYGNNVAAMPPKFILDCFAPLGRRMKVVAPVNICHVIAILGTYQTFMNGITIRTLLHCNQMLPDHVVAKVIELMNSNEPSNITYPVWAHTIGRVIKETFKATKGINRIVDIGATSMTALTDKEFEIVREVLGVMGYQFAKGATGYTLDGHNLSTPYNGTRWLRTITAFAIKEDKKISNGAVDPLKAVVDVATGFGETIHPPAATDDSLKWIVTGYHSEAYLRAAAALTTKVEILYPHELAEDVCNVKLQWRANWWPLYIALLVKDPSEKILKYFGATANEVQMLANFVDVLMGYEGATPSAKYSSMLSFARAAIHVSHVPAGPVDSIVSINKKYHVLPHTNLRKAIYEVVPPLIPVGVRPSRSRALSDPIPSERPTKSAKSNSSVAGSFHLNVLV